MSSDARRFTEHTLRFALEVLDRRRNVRQLQPLLTPPLIDLMRALALAPAPERRLGAATLRRVHLRAQNPDALEAFGTYCRGNRVFAIAARVEATSGTGWTMTSLLLA